MMKRSPLLALLIPKKGRYTTAILLDLNIFVFALMVLSGAGFFAFRADDLLAWGANYRPALEGHGVLRLLTSMFLHGGLMHLLMNLYGLLIAGSLLEPALGSFRLAAAYLLSGLAGSVASVVVHPATVSVGASGAIFGLFGLLLVMMALGDGRVAALKRVFMTNVMVFVALNLVLGFLLPGIDNAAHIGGFLMGALLACLVVLEERAKARGTQAP